MQELYMSDSYIKEFSAVVMAVSDEKYIVLDKTAFYPVSGGQPNDTGTIYSNGSGFRVVSVGRSHGRILHEVEQAGLNPGGIRPGDVIKGAIDWERRYRLMRMHTAAHLLSSIIHKQSGAKITGNQLQTDKSRIDFNLENLNDIHRYVAASNNLIRNGAEVRTYFQSREIALQDPALFALKDILPPDVDELRIVEIVGIDTQACGGCHVNNISEIGNIRFLKSQNKGKNNRRLYFTLE